MEAHKKVGLDEKVAKCLFRQMAHAVHELHRREICHRDLKPDNIVLKLDPSWPSGHLVTVIDFNVSVDMSLLKTPSIIGETGVKIWSGPETRFCVSGYDRKCDVYSLGCLLLHMLTGRSPKPELAEQRLKERSEEVRQLVGKMMESDPKLRLAVDEVRQHSWLAN